MDSDNVLSNSAEIDGGGDTVGTRPREREAEPKKKSKLELKNTVRAVAILFANSLKKFISKKRFDYYIPQTQQAQQTQEAQQA
jgi:hypothetical protein